MLDDDMPNFPETSPQDYYPQEMEENQPEQVQEFQEIQEVPVQQSQIENQNQSPFSYQAQPQLQSPSYTYFFNRQVFLIQIKHIQLK